MIFSIDDEDRRNRVALIDGAANTSWTYGKLADEVCQRRDSIADSRKQLLFLFCCNDLDSVAWYLAGMEAGHALALLNDQIDAQLADNLISLYRPDRIRASQQINSVDYESLGVTCIWRRRQLDGEPLHQDLSLL